MNTTDSLKKKSGAQEFEDGRWNRFTQPHEFRHDAALSLIRRGPILDIGCGDGLLLSLLRERNIEAEGADISSEAIARCQERGLKARVFDPADSLPYPDNSFECVIMLDVLEHVYDPAALLAEAKRISRSEIIVGVPNFSSLPARIQVLRGRVPENNQPNKGHVYWFNRDVLNRLTSSAGLRETGMKMNTFRPFTKMGTHVVAAVSNVLALSFVGRYEKKGNATADSVDKETPRL